MQAAGVTDVDVNVAGPFRHRRIGDDYLITNDFGDWLFLSAEEFKRFVHGEIAAGEPLHDRLKEKRFIHGALPLNQAVERYRALRWFLDHGPRTHTLALGEGTADGASMASETVDRAIDCAFMSTSPELAFVLTGGEPLAHWDAVERAVTYVESKNRLARKRVSVALYTSLSGLTDERVSFLAEHAVQVHARIAGADLDAWGDLKTWVPKFHDAYAAADQDAEVLHVTVDHTDDGDTPADLSAEVDLAVSLGCQTIALNPAPSRAFLDDDRGPAERLDAWLASYVLALDACIAHEADGRPVAEATARVLTQRVLGDRAPNRIVARSPAADGIGELAYHWDGRVFSSEEGRALAEFAEDEMFKLGELRYHGYHDMITSPTVRALVLATLLEGQPGCSESAYAPFGGLSPAACYAEHGSIHGRPLEHSGWRQLVHTLDALFTRLRAEEDATGSVLKRWSEPT